MVCSFTHPLSTCVVSAGRVPGASSRGTGIGDSDSSARAPAPGLPPAGPGRSSGPWRAPGPASHGLCEHWKSCCPGRRELSGPRHSHLLWFCVCLCVSVHPGSPGRVCAPAAVCVRTRGRAVWRAGCVRMRGRAVWRAGWVRMRGRAAALCPGPGSCSADGGGGEGSPWPAPGAFLSFPTQTRGPAWAAWWNSGWDGCPSK